MKHQLIVMILGTDRSGIISDMMHAVSECNCNILDSRHAIYGQEFTLTMIVEGTQNAITKIELAIPTLCQRLELLSMMKRTRAHTKQHLAHMRDLEINGVDNPGQIKHLTRFLDVQDVAINAFRQRTYIDDSTQRKMMRCKLVVSLPCDCHPGAFYAALQTTCEQLELTATFTDKAN
jgi:glycine cleavage system transcriptional repressor